MCGGHNVKLVCSVKEPAHGVDESDSVHLWKLLALTPLQHFRQAFLCKIHRQPEALLSFLRPLFKERKRETAEIGKM